MLLIPTANPIPFTLTGINEPEVDRAFYRKYYQKFQRSDTTMIQVLAPNADSQGWSITVQNADEVVMPYTFTHAERIGAVSGYHAHEWNIDFSQFAEGLYRLTLANGSGEQYLSDYICIKNEQPYTRLLTYRNSYNAQSVAFRTGIVFHLRVEYSEYKGLLPKSEDSIYAHDYGAYRTLSSYPYNNKRVFIGGNGGIPDWLAAIVNQAFSCDTLFIDSEEVTKAEGAAFEAVEAETSLRSWAIEIGRVNNSLVYEEHIITVNGSPEYDLKAPRDVYSEQITVFSTAAWRIVGTLPAWVSVLPAQGVPDGQEVTISLTENTDIVHRTALVQFQSVDYPSVLATLNIRQEAAILVQAEWGAFICDYLNRSGAFNALATSAGDIIQTASGEDILVTPGYTYNGVAITTGIVIHRTVEGITITNYPKFYSLLSAFDAQPEITAEAFRKLLPYNKIV